MGKKQNGKGPNLDVAPPLPQKELYQRVNFALQSSTFLQQLGESSQTRKGKRKAQDGSDHHVEDEDVSGQGLGDVLNELSRGQMKSTKKMAAHTQLKLDPSLKRSICKGCGTFLVPGLTARIRNKPDKRTMNKINTTCLNCNETLQILSPPTTHPSDQDLDGPRRKKRRGKIIQRSKNAFHTRERRIRNDQDGGGAGETSRGHSLWAGEERVVNWGENSVLDGGKVIPKD